MTLVARGDLIMGSRSDGIFQHRGPDGTLIDSFQGDLGHFNRVRGVGLDTDGNSYFCMERIDGAKRPGATSARGRQGIIRQDNTFTNNAANQIDWGTFDYGTQSATSNVFEPMDIVQLHDGTFVALMHMQYNVVANRPGGHFAWMGLWHLDADGAIITRWDNVNTDFDGLNGVFDGRIAADCADANIVYYTHYSQTIFRFNISTGVNIAPFKQLRDARLPFTFGDLQVLAGGTIVVAMSEGFRSGFGTWATPGLTSAENNTAGPREAITMRSNGTSFFADQGFYARNPGNVYHIKEHSLATGLVVSFVNVGTLHEPSALATYYNACAVISGVGEQVQLVWVG